MSAPALPGVVLWTWFKGRSTPIVPGETGAEDLAVLVPLAEPVSAGKPPIAPVLVSSLELVVGDGGAGGASVQAGSGWRITRAGGGAGGGDVWGSRAVVELEWPSLTEAEWATLGDWMLDNAVLGGSGGSLNAMTIDVDGEDLPGHEVEVRAIDVPANVETLLERLPGVAGGSEGVYRFGPLRCEEVL